MCWICPIEQFQERVTSKDIRVFKIVKIINNKIVSLYQDYIYKLGESNPIEKRMYVLPFNDTRKIIHGYHSYSYDKISINFDSSHSCFNISNSSTQELLDWVIANDDFYYVAECIIPKGVKYYLNPKGEYVSESIIISSIIPIKSFENFI